ncbi:MAG TPA: uroporphyrinogen-III synthase [Thermodesulfobacteriota bacterium]|nr:uroporphyrinogen-III synthase [Thermodesulfobacteriota bacterium]
MNKQPLGGRRILITRARQQSGDFTARLRKLGAEVIEFPTIEMIPPLRWDAVDQAVDRLNSYDWIIFTSANGVTFFWQRLSKEGGPNRFPSSLRVCAIGPATAGRLREKRTSVHYIPKEYIAESILEGFEKIGIRGKRILLARAKKARDVLPKGLRKMGGEVDVVEVYRTIKPKGGSKKLKKLLADGKIDVITFTSSSTVNHFADLLKKEDLKTLLKNTVTACIGPVTAKTAREWGLKVGILPRQYTIPGLTRAIADYYER